MEKFDYIYDYNNDFKKLVVVFKRKQDGTICIHSVCLDDNPLITADNVTTWTRYLHRKVKELVTEEAMHSDLFKTVEREIEEERRHHAEWLAKEPERRRRENHKKELRRTPSLGFIPDGLNADYSKEYGWYIDSAIQWTPEDNEEFLYQIRSLERMATKCVHRCIEQNRPDAAYEQTAELLRSLPRWMRREELSDFFSQYKPRLRKLVKTVCQALTDSAIRWNNMPKLIEANALIEGLQSEFITWGLKPKAMLELQSSTILEGEPLHIERKPNKQELQAQYMAEYRRKREEERKAAEERERKALIKLNPEYEKLFDRRYINMDCDRIANNISPIASQIEEILKAGLYLRAVTMYLQLLKSMCKHFTEDEHYNYFDDMYSPEYSMHWILEAIHKYDIGTEAQALLDAGHAEIRQTECYTDYGVPSFV